MNQSIISSVFEGQPLLSVTFGGSQIGVNTQAVSYPRPSCISTQDPALLERVGSKMVLGYDKGRLKGCRCNSQQGTRMSITFEACISYVDDGAFDPAKPDPMPIAQGVQGVAVPAGASEARAATAGAASNLTVVADTEYSSRPWHNKR